MKNFPEILKNAIYRILVPEYDFIRNIEIIQYPSLYYGDKVKDTSVNVKYAITKNYSKEEMNDLAHDIRDLFSTMSTDKGRVFVTMNWTGK